MAFGWCDTLGSVVGVLRLLERLLPTSRGKRAETKCGTCDFRLRVPDYRREWSRQATLLRVC
jgi:hypothetical protein